MPGTLSSSFAYTRDARITKRPHTLQFAISPLAHFFNSSLSYAHIPFTNYWNTAFHMLMTQFSETPAGFYSTISFEQSFFRNRHLPTCANRAMEQNDIERAIAFGSAIRPLTL